MKPSYRFIIIALCVTYLIPTPASAIATIVRDDVESMAFFNLLQQDISANGGLSVPACPAGASGQGAGKCQSVPGGNVYGLFAGWPGGDKFLAYNGYASLDRACMAAFGPSWYNDHAATSYTVRSYSTDRTVMYWNGTKWDTFVAKTDTHTLKLVCVSNTAPENIAPFANAGIDRTIVLPTSSISPSSQSAADSDGSIAKYVWARVGGAGTSTVLITNGTTLTPTFHRMTGSGTYTYRLTVTDNWGLTASDDMTVTVTSNLPPVVNAGADRTITLPTTSTTPSGQSATDEGGTITKQGWTRVGGTGTSVVSFSKTTGLSPTFFNLSAAGTYIFRLSATDKGGLTATDDMTVTVLTAGAPTAGAGGDVAINLPTSSANPSGQSATGAINTYTWTRVGGTGTSAPIITGATTLNPTFTGLTTPGTYIFRLTATNSKGSASDDMTVSVANILIADLESVAPPANMVTPTLTKVGTPTSFAMQIRNTGNATTGASFTNRLRKANDSGGAPDIASAVNVGVNTIGLLASGAATTGFSISYTPITEDAGTRWFSICADEDINGLGTIAESNEGNNCGEWTPVTITHNIAPSVNAGVDITLNTLVGYMTPPSSQSAYDSDGTIVQYVWTYVGGTGLGVPVISNSTTLNPTFSITGSDGSYIFRLTVTDNDGVSAFDEMTVTRATLYPTVTGVTISSPTVIPDGTTPYTISVTGTSYAGGSNVMDLSANINSTHLNAASKRGKIHFSTLGVLGTPLLCPGAGDLKNVVEYDGLASQYFTLHECTTTILGNARTVNFVVSFNPSFTTPLTDNEVQGTVIDRQYRASNSETSNIHTTFSLNLPPSVALAAADNLTVANATGSHGRLSGFFKNMTAAALQSIQNLFSWAR